MKIYKLEHEAEDYRWLEYKGPWFEFFRKIILSTEPIGEFHEKIECTTIRDKKERVLGDYPCFSVPAISEKAKNTLQDFWLNLVEIFPLETGKLGKYYFINIINSLDCLNTDKSEIIYFSDGLRIMRVKKYYFNNITEEESRIFVLKLVGT